jgi:predicted TIM-barrel fold metal-dependent hydrolase
VTTTERAPSDRPRESRVEIIDVDVHNATKSRADVRRYLPAAFHAEYDRFYSDYRGVRVGAAARPSVYRMDTFPETGRPGSDLDLLCEQLLDRYGITKAIVHPVAEVLSFVQYGTFGLALAAALNEWMLDKWLRPDHRIFGAISVPVEDGSMAAAEIERMAAAPEYVKVMIPASTREPLGHSKYWPIYEAAEAHGLPIAAHVGGFSGADTAPTYFVESHANLVMSYPAQAASLVYSGVFTRFPRLKLIFEEGGLAWLAPLMWRLDRAWEDMRDDLPQLDERPSDVLRRHSYLTTQPIDEPDDPKQLRQLLRQLDLDDKILFASDYPHWDFDDPNRVLQASLIGAELRERILATNAKRIFDFERRGA